MFKFPREDYFDLETVGGLLYTRCLFRDEDEETVTFEHEPVSGCPCLAQLVKEQILLIRVSLHVAKSWTAGGAAHAHG